MTKEKKKKGKWKGKFEKWKTQKASKRRGERPQKQTATNSKGERGKCAMTGENMASSLARDLLIVDIYKNFIKKNT
jgi:hypothetical protein